jgi:uncharacterized protein YjbJ (UPF0337 family)
VSLGAATPADRASIGPGFALCPSTILSIAKVNRMNWDQIKGKWTVYKGQIKQRWGKLTDDDLDVIAGKRDVLAGKLQQLYGIAKEQAERDLKEFEKQCKESSEASM